MHLKQRPSLLKQEMLDIQAALLAESQSALAEERTRSHGAHCHSTTRYKAMARYHTVHGTTRYDTARHDSAAKYGGALSPRRRAAEMVVSTLQLRVEEAMHERDAMQAGIALSRTIC